MHTADVVTEDDVEAWVRDAIAYELTEAGYRLVDGSVGDAGTVLSGKVLTVYCKAMFNYEGQVSFFATLARAGSELIDERYTGEGSAGLNWTATGKSYSKSLAQSLELAVLQLIEDIGEQFPAE